MRRWRDAQLRGRLAGAVKLNDDRPAGRRREVDEGILLTGLGRSEAKRHRAHLAWIQDEVQARVARDRERRRMDPRDRRRADSSARHSAVVDERHRLRHASRADRDLTEIQRGRRHPQQRWRDAGATQRNGAWSVRRPEYVYCRAREACNSRLKFDRDLTRLTYR